MKSKIKLIKTKFQFFNKIIGFLGGITVFLIFTSIGIVRAQFISSQPNNINVCYKISGKTRVLLSRKNSLDSFRWEYFNQTTNNWLALQNDTNWSGVNKDTLTFKNAKVTNLKIRCVIDSLRLNVKIFTSGIASVVSYSKIQPAIIKSNQIKCFGATSDTLKIQSIASGGDSIISNTWQTRQKLTSYAKSGLINDKVLYLGKVKKTLYVRLKTDYNKCGSSYSDSITISVYDSITNPIIGNNQLICYNSKPNLLVIKNKSKGGGDTFRYNWLVRNVSSVKFSTIDTINRWQLALNNHTEKSFYKVRGRSHNGCGDFFSDSIVINIYTPLRKPVISKSQSICYNSTPNLLSMDSSAKGGNDTFTYQWQRRLASGSWNDLIGFTGTTYSPSNLSNSYYYRIKAISTKLCGIVYSDSIYINVFKPLKAPKISGSQIICFLSTPDDLSIDSVASGGNGVFTYYWQQKISGVWQDVGTVNATKLILSNMSSTTHFRIKAVSASLCGTVYSDSVKIAVLPQLTKQAIGFGQVVCYNAVPNLLEIKTLAAGGNDSFDYQWYLKDGGVWNKILNAKQIKYQPSGLNQTTYYKTSATSRYGCGTIFSDSVIITVLSKLTKSELLHTNSFGRLVCHDNIPNLQISKKATGGTEKFTNQWYFAPNKGNYQKLNDTGIVFSNVKGGSLTVGNHWFKVLSANSCGVIFSDSIEVTVLNPIIIPKISASQKICYDFTPNSIKLESSPTGGSNQYKYNWQKSFDNSVWTKIGGATQRDHSPGSMQATTFFRCLINDSVCGDYPSNPMKIQVLGELKKTKLDFLDSLCFNTSQKQSSISFQPLFYPKGGNDTFVSFIETSFDQVNWSTLGEFPASGFSESNLRNSKYYRVRSISGYGCGTIYSETVYQHVYDSFTAPIIGSQLTNIVVCEDDSLSQHISELKKHSLAGSSFNYSWQRLRGGTWEDIQGEKFRSFNRRFYADLAVRMRVESRQGCGNLLSNVINIKVNNRPDTFQISGPNFVCKESKLQYYEISKSDDYTFTWSAQNGVINKGQSTPQLLVDWYSGNYDVDTIKLLRIDKNNSCSNIIRYPVIISKNVAPQPAQIQKINGTRILVCSDTTPGVIYNWGYLRKKDRVEIIEKKQGFRYHEYNEDIDTLTRIYFVKTDIGSCITTSFYATDIWKLDVNSANAYNNKFVIYPNPSFTGKFQITDLDFVDKNELIMFSRTGAELPMIWDGEFIDISRYPRGLYTITNREHTRKTTILFQ